LIYQIFQTGNTKPIRTKMCRYVTNVNVIDTRIGYS